MVNHPTGAASVPRPFGWTLRRAAGPELRWPRRGDRTARELAASRDDPTRLRKLSRASLEHAFLQGRSLWRARDVSVRAPACRHDTPGARHLSRRCGRLLRTSRKANVQCKLETRLRRFERSVARSALRGPT